MRLPGELAVKDETQKLKPAFDGDNVPGTVVMTTSST
jgi:hypothetical protein